MTENTSETKTWGRQTCRLGTWKVEPSLNRLSGPEGSVQLEPRIMDLLVFFMDHGAQVVSRREILDQVWADVVVGEEALTRAVSELRRLLGDDTQSPQYIETIRKGGYRLVAVPEAMDSTVEPAASRPTLPRPLWPALGLLAISILTVLWFIGRPQPETNTQTLRPLTTSPLTSYDGNEQMPALSPDGTMVAFAWDGPGQDRPSIYVKQIGHDNPLQLTDLPGWCVYPRWLPDGHSLAFVYADSGGSAIFTVPLLGGQPQLILQPRTEIMGMAWADASTLYYADAEERGSPSHIYRRNLATGQDEQLTDAGPEIMDMVPLLSPDGRTVSFLRRLRSGEEQIHLLNIATGQTRLLTNELGRLEGLDWTGDSQSLVCSSRLNGNYTLWRVDVDSGQLRWVPVHGEWMFYPTVAYNSNRLAYQHRWFEKNVWRISRDPDTGVGIETSAVVTSTRWDCEAYPSTDGSRLAFTSSRSGFLEIWTCQIDGSRPVQITHFGGPSVGAPRWSPDNKHLVLTAGPEGFSDLFVVELSSRKVTRITRGDANHRVPSWSQDGQWIYCSSDRNGVWDVWKIPVNDVGGDPVQVTQGTGVCGFESADARYLYYMRAGESGLLRLDLAADPTTEPVQILTDLPHRNHWDNWALWSDGAVFLDHDDEGAFLTAYSFETGQTTVIDHIPSIAVPSLAVTQDGQTVFYARVENSVQDLMLVEGFE